jgi:uncharacterized membrane protein YqjE
MSDQQPSDSNTQNIAKAIDEVSQRAVLLIHEEIELAKVEVTQKITKLLTGAVVGIAAGIFAVFGLVFLLHGLAWLAWFELFPDNQYFWCFFVFAAILFLLGALAGFIASRALKSGAPPVPVMAIDEAKRIRETVTSKTPEQIV